MSIDTGSIAFLPGLSGLEGGVRRGPGTVRCRLACAGLWTGETFAAACRRECLKRRQAETGFTAVQRAGAKCPVRCADANLVGAVFLRVAENE